MAPFPPTRYRTDGPRPAPRSGAVACAEASTESDSVATQHGPLAQLVARLVRIEEVRSSNLLGSTRTVPEQQFLTEAVLSRGRKTTPLRPGRVLTVSGAIAPAVDAVAPAKSLSRRRKASKLVHEWPCECRVARDCRVARECRVFLRRNKKILLPRSVTMMTMLCA